MNKYPLYANLLFAAALSACAPLKPVNFTGPEHFTQEKYDADLRECTYQAIVAVQAVAALGPLEERDRRQRVAVACMVARGYTVLRD